MQFTATVTVQGTTYTSRAHRHKQMATPEAAYLAYKALYKNEPSATKARPNLLGSSSGSDQVSFVEKILIAEIWWYRAYFDGLVKDLTGQLFA